MSGPQPFTPPDCDLRGMPYMPLYGDRLFGSATWIGASAEAKVAALRLWWRSFAHEVPSASLPDDDTLLADYAGYGVGVKAWRKVRDQAMRGWVKCSDGRLYHRTVAEVALEAWEQRKRNREKQERWRNKNRSVTPSVTVTETVTEPLCNAGSEVKGEGREGNNYDSAVPAREDLALAEWQSGASGHGWRSADFMTSTRRFKLRAALDTYGGLEGWKRVLEKASEAGFFLDDDDKWHPWFSLDWLLDEDRIARLLEGAYAERKKPPPSVVRSNRTTAADSLPAAEPWEQRMRGWRERKQWLPQIWGPAPGQAGCRVPQHLIGGTA